MQLLDIHLQYSLEINYSILVALTITHFTPETIGLILNTNGIKFKLQMQYSNQTYPRDSHI